MYTSFEVKPWHFFFPLVLGLIGALLQHWHAVAGAYQIAYVSAGACLLWLFYFTKKFQDAENYNSYARFLEAYHNLTPDEKIERGYKVAAGELKITTTDRANSGTIQQVKFDLVPWSEGKFQSFAAAILRGARTAFGEWEGGGRLFRDGEYEKGMNKLIDLGYFVKRGDAVNSPREITDIGIRAFAEYFESLGLPYEITPEYKERLENV